MAKEPNGPMNAGKGGKKNGRNGPAQAAPEVGVARPFSHEFDTVKGRILKGANAESRYRALCVLLFVCVVAVSLVLLWKFPETISKLSVVSLPMCLAGAVCYIFRVTSSRYWAALFTIGEMDLLLSLLKTLDPKDPNYHLKVWDLLIQAAKQLKAGNNQGMNDGSFPGADTLGKLGFFKDPPKASAEGEEVS
jgi:hypothetical protein